MSNSNKINLMQMQSYFERQMPSVRLISDLKLSENDFRSLSAKLKSLCFFNGSETDIEEYMLSVVVHSTYCMIYGDERDWYDSILGVLINNSPHLERTYLRMFVDVFHVYGIDTFGLDNGDLMTQCLRLVARHVGVPDVEKYEFYDVISECLECNDVDYISEKIFGDEPHRAKYLVSLLDEEMRKRMILDARMLVSEVIDGIKTRDELLKAYPGLSISFIDSCIMWNEANKYRIRYTMRY